MNSRSDIQPTLRGLRPSTLIMDEIGTSAQPGLWESIRPTLNNTFMYPPVEKFNLEQLKATFNDLFNRRQQEKDRKIVLYTNSEGLKVFNKALKKSVKKTRKKKVKRILITKDNISEHKSQIIEEVINRIKQRI